MNLSYSQVRMPALGAMTGFAAIDSADYTPLDYLGGGGAPVIQTFGSMEQSNSQSLQDEDVDAGTHPQDEENVSTGSVQLPNVAVVGNASPWLRRASLYRAVNYKGPTWLTGQENWVYLVVLALAAGSAWWYFNRK